MENAADGKGYIAQESSAGPPGAPRGVPSRARSWGKSCRAKYEALSASAKSLTSFPFPPSSPSKSAILPGMDAGDGAKAGAGLGAFTGGKSPLAETH